MLLFLLLLLLLLFRQKKNTKSVTHLGLCGVFRVCEFSSFWWFGFFFVLYIAYKWRTPSIELQFSSVFQQCFFAAVVVVVVMVVYGDSSTVSQHSNKCDSYSIAFIIHHFIYMHILVSVISRFFFVVLAIAHHHNPKTPQSWYGFDGVSELDYGQPLFCLFTTVLEWLSSTPSQFFFLVLFNVHASPTSERAKQNHHVWHLLDDKGCDLSHITFYMPTSEICGAREWVKTRQPSIAVVLCFCD